ncbi:hypothetical protein [Seonamhaeicola maritimus]|uniref:Uncharacterized protein n=1 Tax=Seonamhaeicola maritimus TaxID=2591822 RepID=A0A5C7GM93_9FLAO|nr:hypothetical protein [Seonamhaeicola maritimus]TXG39408.1 hypothetical protein FUA22_05920 [Seonamhaeicola maritimus]
MSKLKENIAFKAIMLLLVAALFTPTAIKFAHVFAHHEHKVCVGENSIHFHQIDLDCDFQEFNVHQNATFVSFYFDVLIEKEYHPEIESQYIFLSKYQRLHFSLRGPPAINLS